MAKTEQPKAKDLSSLLIAEIGGLGRYQLRTLAMCAIVTFLSGVCTEYVFSTARIPTRCYIPECDVKSSPEFSPPWLPKASPGGCERYAFNGSFVTTTVRPVTSAGITVNPAGHSITPAGHPSSFCSAEMFDKTHTEKCEHFVYENSNSIVYEFNLGCDEWRRSLVGSFSTAGTFLALPLTGFVSDRWGRRVAISLNAFNLGWVGLLRYWSNSYWLFMLMKLAEVIVGGAGFTCSYVIRATMHSMFAVGSAAVALIAWLAQDWRTMTLCLYAPQLLCLSYFWLMDDTVRWLLSKERYDDAERILRKISKTNKKNTSDEVIQEIIDTAKNTLKVSESAQPEKEAWLPILVFRCKPVLINCLVAPVWWVTMTFVYYGLSVNSVNISGNAYVNFGCVALADLVGYCVGVVALRHAGRRVTLLAAYWIAAVCLIAFTALPKEYAWAALVVYLGGKACMAMAGMGIYVYTSELFPTRHRHVLLAYCSMLGRIGAVLAPLTPAVAASLFKEFPFIMFIAMCFLSGALLVFTPETRNSRLPDTMQEAAALGRKISPL